MQSHEQPNLNLPWSLQANSEYREFIPRTPCDVAAAPMGLLGSAPLKLVAQIQAAWCKASLSPFPTPVLAAHHWHKLTLGWHRGGSVQPLEAGAPLCRGLLTPPVAQMYLTALLRPLEASARDLRQPKSALRLRSKATFLNLWVAMQFLEGCESRDRKAATKNGEFIYYSDASIANAVRGACACTGVGPTDAREGERRRFFFGYPLIQVEHLLNLKTRQSELKQ